MKLATEDQLASVHVFLDAHLSRHARVRVADPVHAERERAAMMSWLNSVMRPAGHATPAAIEVQRIRERLHRSHLEAKLRRAGFR